MRCGVNRSKDGSFCRATSDVQAYDLDGYLPPRGRDKLTLGCGGHAATRCSSTGVNPINRASNVSRRARDRPRASTGPRTLAAPYRRRSLGWGDPLETWGGL